MFALGRKLMKLSEQALPKGELNPAVRSVLIDVAGHPASSISEITARTGFPQSHVSASVARLRDLGAVATAPDPADGRRTLVTVRPRILGRVARRKSAQVDGIIADAMGAGDGLAKPSDVAEVLAALELLSRRLTPKARARIAAGRAS